MKGAASRVSALVATACVIATAADAAGNTVTNADRSWVNFTHEAAVVGDNRFWVELRGMALMDDLSIDQRDDQGAKFQGPTLGLNGYPVNEPKCSATGAGGTPRCIESIDGGRFDLVGAYGLGANVELGVDLPFVMQEQFSFTDGSHKDVAGIGDMTLYGKFKRQLAEHWAGALGLEINVESGSAANHLGAGATGLNPFLSTRYEAGHIALGAHVGFLLNTGNVADVFNWSLEGIVRPTALFALRCEVNGRQFHDFGNNYTDVSVWPGLDLNLTDYLIIRPQAEAHVSNDAIDWGLGLGLVFTM